MPSHAPHGKALIVPSNRGGEIFYWIIAIIVSLLVSVFFSSFFFR